MKPSEFYEKYWKIKNSDGTLSDPKPLTQKEKDDLDKTMSSPLNVFHMRIVRKPSGETIDIDVEEIEKQMKNLPDFLTQTIPSGSNTVQNSDQ